jgi:hypothetical protein
LLILDCLYRVSFVKSSVLCRYISFKLLVCSLVLDYFLVDHILIEGRARKRYTLSHFLIPDS